MVIGQILVAVIVGLVVFTVVRQVVRWTIATGVPTTLYLKVVYPRHTLVAHARGDAKQADRQIYKAYLAQLTAPRDADREIAVKYLEQLSPTQELANRLIAALPLQRRRAIQTRMAQLLRKTLGDLERGNHIAKSDFEDQLPDWSRAVSVWITEVALVGLGWSWLAQLSIGPFIVISLIALGVTLLSLTWIISDRSSILRLGGLLLGLALAGLWSFSEVSHAGIDSTARRSLAAYGLGDVEVQLSYPRWLTAEDLTDCSDKITLTVFGNLHPEVSPIEMLLAYNHANLYLANKECNAVSSRLDIPTNNLAGEPVEFFVKLPRREILSTSAITVTPAVRDPAKGGPYFPALDLSFAIQLEDPLWQTIRDLCKFGFGVTTAPALLAILYRWYRKKQ